MRAGLLVLVGAISRPVASQQIWDIWQTTWDRQSLFTSLAPSSPVTFGSPGGGAAADIVVSEGNVFQTINGFGGTLTDSSALVLNNLKNQNAGNYWSVLGHMFSVADGADAAGLSYLRVPIGASDFSDHTYSLDDVSGDTSFNQFNINNAPGYLFSVIKDIMTINSALKVHILPWSPPWWMKTSGTMNGGTIQDQFVGVYPTYLLKAIQGFWNQGIPIYAISVQNEPTNDNPTYPTCTYSPDVEGRVGAGLRNLLNNNGLSSVKVVGYEHNWDNPGYPISLIQDDGNVYDGVAFHCYAGSVGNQDQFHNSFPNKNVYFTECSGTYGSDWWTDIKWYMDNLWIGSLEHWAGVGLMYNIALDGNGNPLLPGTNSCVGGCRPLVTVNGDGSFSYNQEFYSIAHASKAIIPKDAGGPWGRRIGVNVQGDQNWALRVGAYSTKRTSSSDWNRYALVVMNLTATIEFRGQQATYTFPVGVTTLWWFAAPNGQGLVTGFNATTVPANVTSSPTKVGSASSHKSSSASAPLRSASGTPVVANTGALLRNGTAFHNGTVPAANGTLPSGNATLPAVNATRI
ncbi:glycoside hydrolase superfamily [Mycena capillaripes]|nr:glycoside hydrolase superfamily [Mycena capillaripes]